MVPARNIKQPISDVQFTDQTEKQHVQEVAKHVGMATNALVDPNNLTPIINQNPLPQFTQPVLVEETTSSNNNQPDSGITGLMEGMQGKPRNAPASSFLKSKLEWMKKKFGPNVGLVKKG